MSDSITAIVQLNETVLQTTINPEPEAAQSWDYLIGIPLWITKEAISLAAGATAGVSVIMVNTSMLANSTSLMGMLGSVAGEMSRDAGGTYYFAPSTAPAFSIEIAPGSLFVASAATDRFGNVTITKTALFANSGSIGGGNPHWADGIQYYYAWTDSNKRFAAGVDLDGRFVARKLFSPQISTVTVSASTSIVTPRVDLGSNRSIFADPGYATLYQHVEIDANKRIASATRNDGTKFFPKAEIGSLSVATATATTLTAGTLLGQAGKLTAVHASSGVYGVEQIGSDYQIFLYANGNRTQLTSVNSNHSPAVTAETPARILFSSNRTGAVSYFVMDQDGGRQSLAHAPATYAMWGDSMTGNLRGFIPNNGRNVVTQAFLDKGLTSLGNERRLVNMGIGSQTAVQIAARQGGLLTTCQVTGGQLPASGSVALTSVYPDLLYNPTSDGRLTNFPVSIRGIAGILARVDATNYTFTRSATGSVVSASGTSTIVPGTTDAAPIIAVDLIAGPPFVNANTNEYTSILWLGHNGVGGSNGETLLSLVNGCVANIRNLSKRFLILPIFNATTESGTSGYTTLQNSSWLPLASAYPSNYYDIRADFIASAKTWMQANYPTEYASDWGQPYTGTRANAGIDSDYDISKDMIPRALRGDLIHLNSMGNDLFSELLATKLLSLGW